jgi:hypothetical protein
MPDRPDFFRCPLCKSVSCERVIVRRADGTNYLTSFYACTTCTVMFLDPLAFTRGFEDRPQTLQKSTPERSYSAWALINQKRKDRNE